MLEKVISEIEEKNKIYNKFLENENNKTILNKWLKSELSYTSNSIEGNTLTRKETILAIEENITSSSKPINDYLGAVNHAKAFEYVVETANNKEIQINKDIILNVHKIILNGIDNKNAGFYRDVRVRILGSQTVLPNPLKVPELMLEFNNWSIENNIAPILKSIEVHYKLVSIHPFVDGNGRTARLLMNLILIRNNYCPIIIRTIDRKKYLNNLEKYQNQNGKEQYDAFMLKCLNRSYNTILSLLSVEKQSDDNKLLTISQFAKLNNVPVSTLRYLLRTKKLKPVAFTNGGYMLFDKKQKI
jgi:Fic family protein